MIQYVQNIIVPFVERTRESLGEDEDKAAVVIMDNFKGQVTPAMTELLERHHIHSCLIPPNTTDRLQPMDIAVNKPAKTFLKEQFQNWYSEQVTRQLDGEDVENVDLEPVELSMAVMKEIGAKWLVDMADYISNNPQFIVNGFLHAGISEALDGNTDNDTPVFNSDETKSESDDEEEDNADDDDDDESNPIIDYIVLQCTILNITLICISI